jgi:23S rRNA-/tRNA-specific pseudouridylate synthase
VEASAGGFSRVRLFPETGRSHQLRVHLQSLGCPIVGDPIYGPTPPLVPLRLFAQRLHFRHPQRGEELDLSLPPPAHWEHPNAST